MRWALLVLVFFVSNPTSAESEEQSSFYQRCNTALVAFAEVIEDGASEFSWESLGWGVLYGVGNAVSYSLWEYATDSEYKLFFLKDPSILTDVVLNPLVEEVYFRTPMYWALRDIFLPKLTNAGVEDLVVPASIISGAVFVGLHYRNYQKGAWVMLGFKGVTGAFHGLLYERAGFTGTIPAHIINNLICWLILLKRNQFIY